MGVIGATLAPSQVWGVGDNVRFPRSPFRLRSAGEILHPAVPVS